MRVSVLLLSVVLFLASRSNNLAVYLIADFKTSFSSTPEIEIWLDGHDAGSCDLPDPAKKEFPSGAVCTFQARRGRHDVFVQIKVPGYKRFTRNIPSFEVSQEGSILDIGAVNLSPSEIPKIVGFNVAQASDRSQSYLVRVDLHNESKKSFFVTAISLKASKVGSSCDIAEPEVDYKLSDRLVVQTEGQDLIGKVVEKANGREYDFPAHCKIVIAPCSGGNRLQITIPAGFPLPPAEFARVNLFLPQKFVVVQTRRGSREQDVDTMSGFDSYEILMQTSDKDEPTILYHWKTDLGFRHW
jgi:hypothetical protein